jgi:hypothetical protein
MTDLTTKIGAFNGDTKTVPVTFTAGEIVHSRDVNAVLKSSGAYDKIATAARVAEVANGVAAKIGLGVIKVAPPVVEPEPETAAQEAETPPQA